MTLKDVLESGRRFRRESEGDTWFSVYGARVWSQEEVLADDWELEEETVTLTVNELKKLIVEAQENPAIRLPSVFIRKLHQGGYK